MPIIVFDHPGIIDASGCHTCRTNCASWGLSDGECHCHNGGSFSSSSSSSNNNKESTTRKPTTKATTTTTTTTQKPKSNDNTLKQIIIDDEFVEVSDELNYKTKNDNVNIEVITNDDKTTIYVNNSDANIDFDYELGDEKSVISDFEYGVYKMVNKRKILSQFKVKILFFL